MEQFAAPQTQAPKNSKRYVIAAVIGAVVFVLLVMVWYYVPVLGSKESSYCARCHSMVPEYMTWQQSTHARFQCQECHRETGLSSFFKYQGRIFSEVFFYSNNGGTVKSPMAESIPNSVCLKCHSNYRKYSPSSDTVVPHQKHIDKGIECVSCHAGIAHGRIVERGATAKLSPNDWNLSVAQEQMDLQNTTPRMAVCLDCHGKRQVNQKCSVCHSRQIVPASHKSREWLPQHGQNAEKDFRPCNLCHSYTLKKPVDLTQPMSVTDYIKSNTYCFNCHLQKPQTHKQPTFREIHGELARNRGLDNCLSCHNVNNDKNNINRGPINKVYCNQCHYFK